MTPGKESPKRIWPECLNRSSPPSLRAWEWGCRSVGLLCRLTAGGFGLTRPTTEPCSAAFCRRHKKLRELHDEKRAFCSDSHSGTATKSIDFIRERNPVGSTQAGAVLISP